MLKRGSLERKLLWKYCRRRECIGVSCQRAKCRNIASLPFLADAITSLVLIETGKKVLVRQSLENVTPKNHRELLDEVCHSLFPAYLQIYMAVLVLDQNGSSDSQSELTLLDEKDSEKDVVDWVKLGFQGKTPETDFRATGTVYECYADGKVF